MLIHTDTHTHTLTLKLTHTHIHTLTHSHSLTHSRAHPHTHSHSLTHSRAHTHTHQFLCGEDGEFTAILDVASQGLANATSEACTVLGQLPTQMMPMCDQVRLPPRRGAGEML